MDMMNLSEVLSSEEAAGKFLVSRGILHQFDQCVHCASPRLRRSHGMNWRCSACLREWTVRRGSLLERSRVTLRQFVTCVKMFELELPALRCAREACVSRNTASKFYMLLRQTLSQDKQQQISGTVEADESHLGGHRKGKRGRGAAGKAPVFGIMERGGQVCVEVVQDVTAATLLKLKIQKVKRGSLIYTDQFRSYDGLVSCGFRHVRINHSRRFANGKVYINGIEGFWSFAKGRLLKHHGISPRHFPLYLKEMEVRYNFRQKDFFSHVLSMLARKSASGTL